VADECVGLVVDPEVAVRTDEPALGVDVEMLRAAAASAGTTDEVCAAGQLGVRRTVRVEDGQPQNPPRSGPQNVLLLQLNEIATWY
jgi:hypothetical protein